MSPVVKMIAIIIGTAVCSGFAIYSATKNNSIGIAINMLLIMYYTCLFVKTYSNYKNK